MAEDVVVVHVDVAELPRIAVLAVAKFSVDDDSQTQPPSDVDVEQILVLLLESRNVGAVGHGLGVVLDEDPHAEAFAQNVGQRRVDGLFEMEGRGAGAASAVDAPRDIDVDTGDALGGDAVERVGEIQDVVTDGIEAFSGVVEPEIRMVFDADGASDEIHQPDVEFEGPHVDPHEAGAGFGTDAVSDGFTSLGVQTDPVDLGDEALGEHLRDIFGDGRQAVSRGSRNFRDDEGSVLHDLLDEAVSDRVADALFRGWQDESVCHIHGFCLLQKYNFFGSDTNSLFG